MLLKSEFKTYFAYTHNDSQSSSVILNQPSLMGCIQNAAPTFLSSLFKYQPGFSYGSSCSVSNFNQNYTFLGKSSSLIAVMCVYPYPYPYPRIVQPS